MSDEQSMERTKLLAQFERDAAFFATHQRDLLESYPDEWVAIYRERVVGAAPDLQRLLTNLRARGVPAEQAFVQRLATSDEPLIV